MKKYVVIIGFLLSSYVSINCHFSSYPFISDESFAAFCDHKLENQVPNIKAGDTIYVDISQLGNFFSNIHSKLKQPYILVSHGMWTSMPGPYAKYLNDEKLIAWFSKNGDSSAHKKMHAIPIGLVNKGHPIWVEFLNFLPSFIPSASKPHERRSDKLMYVNLSLYTDPERTLVYNMFKNSEFSYCTPMQPAKISRIEHIKELSQYKFVASPRGWGIDCHRTWEALLIGTIPIVKRSDICSLFDELPVLIIEDWSQVTREFLEQKFEEIHSKTYNFKKLYADYWFNQIREVQRKFRMG